MTDMGNTDNELEDRPCMPGIALTIRQPWASLIVHGGKDIENRTWPTKFRGPVLIHASKKRDDRELLSYRHLQRRRDIVIEWTGDASRKWKDLPCGGVIGIAEIVDCVSSRSSPWFVGDFGFVLANPRAVPFFACRGALGFWKCEYPKSLF